MEFSSFFLAAQVHEHTHGEGFADSLFHALMHTVEHCWYILPVLFLVYLLIELIGHKAMGKLKSALSNKYLGVVSASALGLIPQCGFSVAASNLYAERLISAGAVAAVFIATSDEALPIIAADSGSIRFLLPLILVKFLFAVAVGYFTDLIFRFTRLDRAERHAHHHHGSEHVHEAGEHHHCAHCDSGKGILHTAIVRSFSVFLFVIVTAFAVNLAVELLGEEALGRLLLSDSIFQPFLTALIGLIPNCAVSVLTANLFAAGTLGFGSLVSALCSGAGIGMLVLFKVNRNMKQNLAIFGIVYMMSAVLGTVIQLIF